VPANVVEEPGRGPTGEVDGRLVAVGRIDTSADAMLAWARAVESRALLDGATVVWVGIDGAPIGAVLLRDPLRPDAPHTLHWLRSSGLTRLVMLTGDRPEPAREVGAMLGLDEVRARQSPADKVAAVREEAGRGDGDGRRRPQRRPG